MNLTPCNACKASGGITASKSSSSVRAVCLPALNSTLSSMLRASPARGHRPYSPGGSGHRPIAGFGECEIWASTDRWCIFCDTVKFREQKKTPAQAQLADTHPTSPRAHHSAISSPHSTQYGFWKITRESWETEPNTRSVTGRADDDSTSNSKTLEVRLCKLPYRA